MSEPPAAETGGGSDRTLFYTRGILTFIIFLTTDTDTYTYTPNLGQVLTKDLSPLTHKILLRYQGFILYSLAVNQEL